MKKISLLILLFIFYLFGNAQDTIYQKKIVNVENESNVYENATTYLLKTDGKLKIGGYAQVDYNQSYSSSVSSNGKLDVHRLVLLFGYKFNDRTQFVTEIEYEHVKEVYIEQAFLDYKIFKALHIRAGLMLIPMGITNEYHEPTTFNGVERPLLDKYIAPTTWREIGAGFTGSLRKLNMNYQAYIVNGFTSYNKMSKLRASDGLRKGRQKGAESFISSPNFATKIEYFGIPYVNFGISGYFGDTQSSLYDGLDDAEVKAKAKADSSIIGVAMLGVDIRYLRKGLEIKGQFYYTSLSNTDEYNDFSDVNLGKVMSGFYLEVGYNIFKLVPKIRTQLIPFIRYSRYNTQKEMESGSTANSINDKTIITTGLGWQMAKGAVFKADFQFVKTAKNNNYSKSFNLGIGIMF